MSAIARTLGLCLAVSLLTSCGGTSSKPPPSGGVTAGGWQVFSQGKGVAAAAVAKVSGTATDPLRIELTVNSTPNVSTTTSYQVQCGTSTTFGKGLSGKTPLTRELRIPAGGGSQTAHGIACFVIGTATKPAGTHMTLTLLERPAPIQ